VPGASVVVVVAAAELVGAEVEVGAEPKVESSAFEWSPLHHLGQHIVLYQWSGG